MSDTQAIAKALSFLIRELTKCKCGMLRANDQETPCESCKENNELLEHFFEEEQ